MAVVPLIEAFLSQLFSPPIVRKMALGFVSGVGLGLVVVSAALNIRNCMRSQSICDIICV